MTILIDPLCRRRPPTWRADQPLDPEQSSDPFATSWIETFRRGVAQESLEALILARQIGLETPCARPTT